MPYVQRQDGAVTGVFAQMQPGYAEEFLADDNSEVLGFLAAIEAPQPQLSEETPTAKLIAFLNENPDVKSLLGL